MCHTANDQQAALSMGVSVSAFRLSWSFGHYAVIGGL
jgi:hypothetical protein